MSATHFEFTAEQEALRQHVREWVNRYCPQDLMARIDMSETYPAELFQRMAEAGLHGVAIPEAYGGSGGSIVDQVIVAEELARRMDGLTWMWGIPSCFGGKSVGLYGSEEQKQRILPAIAAGKCFISICVTEPGGGTDILGSMQTFAEDKGDHFVVNGSKTWCTGAHVADYLLLVTRSKKPSELRKKSDGITVFLCDARSQGITTRLIPKMGLKALGSCEVFLDDVVIPRENLLGVPHAGWSQLMGTLNNERILLAAICNGVIAGVLEESIAYANTRQAFNRPIGAFQAVQHYIADMWIELDASRLMTYQAAWLQSEGRPCGVEATAAKIFASEAAWKAADRGVQIFGGYGYALEYPMQRYLRDVRIWRIAPINNELARSYVAENIGLPRTV